MGRTGFSRSSTRVMRRLPGKAASDPLYPDDPTLPGNRRITLVLLREKPVLPKNANP